MKTRMLTLLMALVMLLALAACGTNKAEDAQSPVDETPQSAPDDLGTSTLYTPEELNDAMLAVKCKFASFEGCELHSIRYAGDEANTEENIAWLNSIVEGAEYTQVAEFLTDLHSPADAGETAWEPDTEYTDYQWWLARTADGDWEIVTQGY